MNLRAKEWDAHQILWKELERMSRTTSNARGPMVLLIVGLMLAACGSAAESTPAAQGNAPVIPPAQPVEDQTISEAGSQDSNEEAASTEPVTSVVPVEWQADGTLVEGAESTLTRMEHGVYMTFSTRNLEPGDAYTIWWVIFNNPENCTDGECGLDDLFLVDSDGAIIPAPAGGRQPNPIGREATGVSNMRATGSISDEDGSVEFRAHLPIGDAIEAIFGAGLFDPMTAEIHLIARTHGPAVDGILHEQLNSPWGGCPEGFPKTPCADVQIAFHPAPESP